MFIFVSSFVPIPSRQRDEKENWKARTIPHTSMKILTLDPFAQSDLKSPVNFITSQISF